MLVRKLVDFVALGALSVPALQPTVVRAVDLGASTVVRAVDLRTWCVTLEPLRS